MVPDETIKIGAESKIQDLGQQRMQETKFKGRIEKIVASIS